MRTLAGDKCIDARCRRLGDIRSGPTSHDADPLCHDRTAGGHVDTSADRMFDMIAQNLATHLRIKFQPHQFSHRLEKRLSVAQPDSCREEGVVANLGVDVERQVGTIDCHIGLHEQTHFAIVCPCHPLRPAPEKPVMNDQEIHLRLGGLANHSLRGIDRRADAGKRAGILDLQAIHRLRVISHLRHAQEVI